MLMDSLWIVAKDDFGEVCPEFVKEIETEPGLKKATLILTCTGVYEATLNGKRVGDFIFAPGCTDYITRLQYVSEDVTNNLKPGKNTLSVLVGNGWFRGGITRSYEKLIACKPALLGKVILEYPHKTVTIKTDYDWQVKKSKVLFSDLYDGEIYDANADAPLTAVEHAPYNKAILIPLEGEKITEQERFVPIAKFVTPKGELVYDFGQEIAGYIALTTTAKKGDVVSLSFAEMLDKDGNFYTENYRAAKCIYKYICKDGLQSYKPHTVFYGFRYIRVDQAPEDIQFEAVVVHSDLKRTGHLKTDHQKLNQLFSNILWGQKGNFLDIPTDCPQRNERWGWTGDAQVFIKTAAYQYDVKKFFIKWLNDMAAEQRNDGAIPNTVPNFVAQSKISTSFSSSPAWGDAAVICPWTLYEMYQDKSVLAHFFPMMERWIAYMQSTTLEADLWLGHGGYGDWLALDNAPGSYKGASDEDLIGSAFYAYSTRLVARAAKVLCHEKEAYYTQKAQAARAAFIKRFDNPKTQTECALLLHFDLTDRKAELAQRLAEMIQANGNHLTTGFVGTPYLLFALSDNGYTDLAYTLLLQEEFPSWLFSVNQGATTIWEHWDGKKEDGSFWNADMNSFNHYAYGSVAEWVYSRAAGICISQTGLSLAPQPDKRLGSLEATFSSVYGFIRSAWHYEGDTVHYEIELPVACDVTIKGKTKHLSAGKYTF